jgi:geranylgeranyl pyrophosphate synthase
MKFNDKYENIKKLCESELLQIEKIMINSVNLRDELYPYVVKFLTSPSKRIRPLVSVLYLKACGYDIQNEHLQILSAVELVHNASLIHDDIIDESIVRRGEKTVSYEFGNKLGVICGDYLLSEAIGLLTKIGSADVIADFTSTLRQMCIGEVNQHFEKFKIGTIDDYIEKSKNKTAYLFQTAVASPLIYSQKPKEIISKASNFALNFGIAFQMRDDILNLVSNDKSKPVKSDIKEGIYSASVIYAKDAENYTAGVEKARCLLNNYIDKAKADINDFDENIYSKALKELAELLKYE